LRVDSYVVEAGFDRLEGAGMKSKMRNHVQPLASIPPRSEQVRREIQEFLRAVDSYPARVAKEPRVSFQQHLCSIFAASHPDQRQPD
jgi:hypothetical protein